ncbi:MAG: two pore domain potassium channel family protein [Acidobacteria bacterium]|nr:two pore domain potassium channel family protein [Acidobacteriota bacterium]
MKAAGLAEVTHASPRKALEVCVFVAAVATIPVVILQERGSNQLWLPAADWTIWITFAVAFATDLASTSRRREYLRTHLVDAAVVILSFPVLPSVLALTRLVRVVRVLRLATVAMRAVPALRSTIGRRELLYVFSLAFILSVAGAGLLTVIEPETVGESFLNAVWWAVVTVTTVGYGDIAPVTIMGRIIAMGVMLVGLGVISTLGASIAAYFVSQENDSEFKRIEERLERIERALERDIKEKHSASVGR